jgi:hypothetical protein
MKTKRVGYFDIETADWTVFVVGGIYLDGQIQTVWHDETTFVQCLFAHKNVEWRAHNGGRFDFLLILKHCQEAGFSIKATMRGSGVLKFTIKNSYGETMTFVDTFALAPVSLAKLSAAAGKTQKGHFNYDDITPGMDKRSALGRQLEDYLCDDLKSLAESDAAWREVIRQVTGGIEPSLTIGGTAWKSASRFAKGCGEDIEWPMDIHDYTQGRAGYFGGRVEVFQQFAPKAFTCDRNSSYPAALVNQPVPVGRRIWGRTLEGEGTVWARVMVPDCRVPPLPLKVGIRLAFPIGEFDGVWTALELRNAVANHGVKVLKIRRSRMAERTTDVLAGWCQRVWNAREEMKPWSGLLKLLANSLTGKLAQSPERAGLGFCHVSQLPSDAKQLTPADEMSGVWYSQSRVEVSPCARPEWSAYLTSEARIELLNQLSSVGDSSVYCDTDSVFSTKPIVRNMGTSLGQWKDEGEISDFASFGPKFYRYDKPDGTRVSKVKGQSLTSNEQQTKEEKEAFARASFESLVAGNALTNRSGAWSLKQSIRGVGVAAFLTRQTVKGRKIDSKWVGSRLAGRNETRAPTLAELVTRFKP